MPVPKGSSWQALCPHHREPSRLCTLPSTHLEVDGRKAEKDKMRFPEISDGSQGGASIGGVPKGFQELELWKASAC